MLLLKIKIERNMYICTEARERCTEKTSWWAHDDHGSKRAANTSPVPDWRSRFLLCNVPEIYTKDGMCWAHKRSLFSVGSQQSNIHMTTRTKLLVETLEIDTSMIMKYYRALRDLNYCVRIQLVPKSFCYERRAFLSPSPIISSDQTAINEFTEKSNRVGNWSPQNYILLSKMSVVVQSRSESTKKVWQT